MRTHFQFILHIFLATIAATSAARAHDVTTPVTWNREISRIVYARCAICHQPGGEAFSLLTYGEARPWVTAVRDSVLTRSMPPWGAIKGFGNFRNEQALTPEEVDLIAKWAIGGAPEGNPDHLPTRPTIPSLPPEAKYRDEIVVSGDYEFQSAFALDGFVVRNAPQSGATKITIQFPDGRIEPLVWLYNFKARTQPFLLRTPLQIPAKAQLRGLAGARLVLLPVTSR